MRLIQYR